MNSVIRHKAVIDRTWLIKNPVNLFSPREDNDGMMFVASHTGELLKINENGTYESAVTLDGQPNSIAFDTHNTLFIADLANATVYTREEGKMNLETKVKDYEGNPFKGPCSIAINKENEVLYICDSGYFGTTCLNRPNASLYLYDLETNVIKPLLQNCLAYASDLVYDYNRGCLYVAETFANRIFRLEQNPIGVYSATHFYQFSGRVGPTALAIDNNGYLFVGRFEFQNKDKEEVDGLISVINPDGVLVGELVLAKMPEITGLYISFEKIDFIYVTEKCSNSVLRLKISNFMQEVLLSEENSRNIN